MMPARLLLGQIEAGRQFEEDANLLGGPKVTTRALLDWSLPHEKAEMSQISNGRNSPSGKTHK
jgi:hypothetical protein